MDEIRSFVIVDLYYVMKIVLSYGQRLKRKQNCYDEVAHIIVRIVSSLCK